MTAPVIHFHPREPAIAVAPFQDHWTVTLYSAHLARGRQVMFRADTIGGAIFYVENLVRRHGHRVILGPDVADWRSVLEERLPRFGGAA